MIDGLGALLSAFSLSVVLVKLENLVGIPPDTLYGLATLPVLFAVYDYYCYRKGSALSGHYLKGIAVANLSYGCLSVGCGMYHAATVTLLGWTYILVELLIVGILAVLELRMADRSVSKE